MTNITREMKQKSFKHALRDVKRVHQVNHEDAMDITKQLAALARHQAFRVMGRRNGNDGLKHLIVCMFLDNEPYYVNVSETKCEQWRCITGVRGGNAWLRAHQTMDGWYNETYPEPVETGKTAKLKRAVEQHRAERAPSNATLFERIMNRLYA